MHVGFVMQALRHSGQTAAGNIAFVARGLPGRGGLLGSGCAARQARRAPPFSGPETDMPTRFPAIAMLMALALSLPTAGSAQSSGVARHDAWRMILEFDSAVAMEADDLLNIYCPSCAL